MEVVFVLVLYVCFGGVLYPPLGCDDLSDDSLKNKTSRRAGIRSMLEVNKNIPSCKSVHLCIDGGVCSVIFCSKPVSGQGIHLYFCELYCFGEKLLAVYKILFLCLLLWELKYIIYN